MESSSNFVELSLRNTLRPGPLERLTQPVLYIMGNDDWVDVHGEHPHERSLYGRRVEFGGWNLVGYQYTLPFRGDANERPESAIRIDLETMEHEVVIG